MTGGLTRREGVAMMLGLAATTCGGAARALAPDRRAPSTLNDVARMKGVRFGSAVAWSPPGADAGSFANPAYAALLEWDCGVLVPENELKWQWTRPSPAEFDFDRFDAMLAYAEAQRMPMRGHTLLWHHSRWFPDWLNNHDFGANPVAEAERILTEHIRAVCRRYGKRIYSYDVVNETIDPETSGFRTTSLSTAMGGGQAVVDLAFHTAREAAPHAELVYNDYMSWEAGNEKHRAGVRELLEGFKARGVPVDALGVQSHIGIFSDDPVGTLAARQEAAWRAFLDEVVAMGYRIVITEFDVNDRALPADPAIRDRAVADYARAYLDIMLDYPELTDILAWGMCDRYSWLTGFDPRADGQLKRGCPYDSAFQSKPLHAAIAEAFAAAPARPEAARAGGGGE